MSPSGARELGRAFLDAEVVRNYRYRQPYPTEIFEILEGLLVEPRTVLDAGSGTGALTIGLARFAKRVDAVDPSAAMLREARQKPGADSERIRSGAWAAPFRYTAEPSYGMPAIVTAAPAGAPASPAHCFRPVTSIMGPNQVRTSAATS